MRVRKYRYFTGDFETTVYKGQKNTEVWAAALVEFWAEDVKIYHSIEEMHRALLAEEGNLCVYFHNLKFDGAFWLSYLINKEGYKLAAYQPADDEDVTHFEWQEISDMPNRSYRYTISNMGQWYTITIKEGDRVIELRDSLKLLPFSVSKIGKDFQTKHQKLEMEYKGLRYAGCEITAEEQEYIANDVLVTKEALEILFEEGHNKLTIGSCCLAEFKRSIPRKTYKEYFPDLTGIALDEEYGAPNVDAYIRKGYKGGWCYLVEEKALKVHRKGITLDVNSLYPSMMHSESGNRYPVGLPTFWRGDYIPEEAMLPDKFFYIRIKTRFYVKEGYLPFIQVKSSLMYKGTQCLRTSDIYNASDDSYYDYYKDKNGELKPAIVELTLTCTDFQLLQEHYELYDTEILDGCYFSSVVGVFDKYIDKYRKIKMESTGARRQLAKLFLNNLYGKMASSDISSFKVAYLKEDGSLGYYMVEKRDRKAGYIAIGAAITSYSRNFTIRAAQQNYYGPAERGFIYADTDSIHCDLAIEEVKGVHLSDTEFCCWKLESNWEEGWYVRQKTNIEKIDGKYHITCAGMPQRCKDLLSESLTKTEVKRHKAPESIEEEIEQFRETPRQITDFRRGLRVPGKLMPKSIKGGVVLVDTYFELN